MSQVEQQVDRALELDAVAHRLLEFAVILERELTITVTAIWLS
jgi:hypothetical protein